MSGKQELEVPETTFVRDIDNRVFQTLIAQLISQVSQVALAEGNFIDSLLGKRPYEGSRAIQVEQDHKRHALKIRIEVAVEFGVMIPEKAEEIQSLIGSELPRMTGLHISTVHVVFKSILQANSAPKKMIEVEDWSLERS